MIFENLNSHNRGFNEPRHRQGRGDGVSTFPCWHLVRPEQRPLRLPGALDRLRHLATEGDVFEQKKGMRSLAPSGKESYAFTIRFL